MTRRRSSLSSGTSPSLHPLYVSLTAEPVRLWQRKPAHCPAKASFMVPHLLAETRPLLYPGSMPHLIIPEIPSSTMSLRCSVFVASRSRSRENNFFHERVRGIGHPLPRGPRCSDFNTTHGHRDLPNGFEMSTSPGHAYFSLIDLSRLAPLLPPSVYEQERECEDQR